MFYRPINPAVPEIAAQLELSDRGRTARMGFSLVTSAVSTIVVPWPLSMAWLAAIIVYEGWIGPIVTDRWIMKPGALTVEARLNRIHLFAGLFGASLYGLFPLILVLTGTHLGLFMAFAWVSGTAIHCFVYFSNTRSLLVSHLGPCIALFVVGLFAAFGATWTSAAMVMTFFFSIYAASMFATDRNALLYEIDQQKAARDIAEEANNAKSQFLATMSHELRTPLNAIIGYAEIIEEESANGAPLNRDDIIKIKRAANHLLGLINEVLDLSKLDARRLTLDLQPYDANALLREVRETLAPLAAANGNTLTIASNIPSEPVMIDALRLRQCLINLAGNACKFTQNGHVTITARRQDETIAFAVKDTGPGIAFEDQLRLFQPFTQADSGLSRKHEGAGLGLAITRALAELMGGSVTLESAPGQGATFTLTIHALSAESETRAAA